MGHIERTRLSLGVSINRLYENGLFFALVLEFLVNGRAALYSAHHRHSVAPFLGSALKILSPNADLEGWFLIGFGAVLLALTVRFVLTGVRMVGTHTWLAFLGMGVYVAISVAIVTGIEPPIAAERYEETAFLFFLAFVVNLSRFLGKGAETP